MKKAIYLFEVTTQNKIIPFKTKSFLLLIRFIVVCLSIYSSKQLNIVKERTGLFHFRGLLMPRCRSPPFLSLDLTIQGKKKK